MAIMISQILYSLVLVYIVAIIIVTGQPDPARVPGTILRGSEVGSCPSLQDSNRARNVLRQNVSAILENIGSHTCGGTSGWKRVGYLDMTNTSQSCPSGLGFKTYNSPLRLCGRASDSRGCWSTFYNVGESRYSRVCGRVRGYQFGATSAFYESSRTIDSYYVEGVSLTHGQSGGRTHIWTFAAGLSEVYDGRFQSEFCQCAANGGSSPPSFVGNDFFCESGLNSPWVNSQFIFYPNDTLWDGQVCTNNGCCQLHNPPYFTKVLPTPTTNNIELRICTHDASRHTDIPIDQVELYVQ